MSEETSIGQVQGFDIYPMFDELGLDTESQRRTAENLFAPDISELLELQSEIMLLGARLQGLMPGSTLSQNVRRYMSTIKILEEKMKGLFTELPQSVAEIPLIFRGKDDLEYYLEGKMQRDREGAEGAAGLARS